MGSGASASAHAANEATRDEVKPLQDWDVDLVVDALERDVKLASLSRYAREQQIDGSKALTMDEAKLEGILRGIGDNISVTTRDVIECIHAVFFSQGTMRVDNVPC